MSKKVGVISWLEIKTDGLAQSLTFRHCWEVRASSNGKCDAGRVSRSRASRRAQSPGVADSLEIHVLFEQTLLFHDDDGQSLARQLLGVFLRFAAV